MSRTPGWATALVAQVAADEGKPAPAVTWRRKRGTRLQIIHMRPGSYDPDYWPDGIQVKPATLPRSDSSGSCNMEGTRIAVTAGRDRGDQKLVVLHELAHAFVGPGHWHDNAFWELAWKFYRRYGVPIRYALQREREFKKSRRGYRVTRPA
jgi:hypothetical protein